MATSKGSKKGSGKNVPKNSGKNVHRKNNKKQEGLKRESIVLITLALSVIFFIANFGIGGVVGAAISKFFFGLFGLVAYIFPILLFFAVIFSISNKNSSVARIKLIAAVFLMIFICTFIQLVEGSHLNDWTVSQYYTECAATKNGGGFFGGCFARVLTKLFGKVGAFIIDLVLIIIAGIVISERSFLGFIKKGSRRVVDTARYDAKQYREDVAIKKKNRERVCLNRAEKKAEGVTFDTKITKEGEEITPQVKEVKTAKEPAKSPQGETVFMFTPAPTTKNTKTIDEEIFPFISKDYGQAADVTDSRMKHYEEEQSSSFEAATGDEDIFKTDSVLDMNLIRDEMAKEESIRELAKDSDKADDIPPAQVETKPDEEDDFEEYIEVPKKTVAKPVRKKAYKFPPIDLLKRSARKTGVGVDESELKKTAIKLQQTLASFGVKAAVTSYSCGPSVTRYELQPETGVRVSKIVSLADDIKLNLAAADIRIEAPIPGKSAVGIEVPNKVNDPVLLGDIIATPEFKSEKSLISFAIGKDVAGKNVMADIAKMPHVLVAGTTGSGKSVCLNSMILSILYKARPDEVKLILVDPKMVEFTAYNGIPHLLTPVVTDPKKAAGALNWAVVEMDKRYQLFSQVGAKDIEGYNEKIENLPDDVENKPEKMYKIVIIMDELADLMMTSGKEAENSIVRLAQKARACGIHLVLATQKPTVDVVTGLIKSNVPSRIALTVASQMDSRVMLDENGADKLLGHGDMLYLPSGKAKPDRLQGPFVSEAEIEAVVAFIKEHSEDTQYSEEVNNTLNNPAFAESQAFGTEASEQDQYFEEAGLLIIDKQRASIGMLQRFYKIGFNRAARIMDQLADAGVVGPEEGTKPRKVLMTKEEFENYLSK